MTVDKNGLCWTGIGMEVEEVDLNEVTLLQVVLSLDDKQRR